MGSFSILAVDDIARINENFTGYPCDSQRKQAAAACYSSFAWYYGSAEKIACITRSLAKGHFFADGNKRTSLMVYLILCRLNGLPPLENNESLVRIFVELAAGRLDVGEVAALLFPCLVGKVSAREDV